MRGILLRGALMATGLAAGGCAAALEPRTIDVPQATVRPVSRMEMVFDYRTAVATVGSIFERDLGLPPFPVRFEFYPDRGALERALLHAGYDPALARRTSSTMVGIGGHRKVLLNASELDRMRWEERLLLLSHELGHTLQYELGGGRRGTSEQWLREGFADWVSVRVLERLQVTTLDDFRRQRQGHVRRAGRSGAPRIAELSTFPQWVAAGERHGDTLYAQAFVAVDLLIERHGFDAVLAYFARFATDEDRAANFRAAFGENIDQFEAAVQARLWGK